MVTTQAVNGVPKELLGTLTPEEFRHLKRRVVAASRAMGYWYQQISQDCTYMHDGHVSARIPGTNTFITKGRGPDRDMMSETTLQKIVQVDIPTRSKIAGEMEVTTMGEIEAHASVYEARPDVVSVGHAHSDYMQLCATFGLKLKCFGIRGMDFVVNGYGLYDKPYMLSSSERGAAMAKALGEYEVCLLAGHGCVTVSTDGPEDCMNNIVELDQLCKMNWMAFTAVGKDYEKYALSDEIIREHNRIRKEMHPRTLTPGKSLAKDLCYYSAAMTRTYREALEG